MAENRWQEWGGRLREHVVDQGLKWGELAEKVGRAEVTLRKWCNGGNKINLEDFFLLCEAAGADPAHILFGDISITDEQRRRLGDLVVSVLSEPRSTYKTPRRRERAQRKE